MKQIPFLKKLITCALAGLIIGATTLRMGVTYFRTWVSIRQLAPIPFIFLLLAVIYSIIWQARKTESLNTLAFWQGLIRYGVAFDLAGFGWEKICHLQLVMPLSKLDLPYSSFSSSDLFWTFYSHSYLFGCIIAGTQIVGAMLLLFRRTTLVGVFVLLPVLVNILLMDIFYEIGHSVVVHASIMLSGLLYFLIIEFDRLRKFFFATSNKILAVQFPRIIKMAIRFSIIYVPLLLIAMHGGLDKYPELTGKYEVKQIQVTPQVNGPSKDFDSSPTVVYFDIRNGCVFEFNTPQNRWNGDYVKENDHLQINWHSPTGKPTFNGIITSSNGLLNLRGKLGDDSLSVKLRKVHS